MPSFSEILHCPMHSHLFEENSDISVLFFALLKCKWREDGSELLENSLLIPWQETFEFNTLSSAACVEFINFCLGILMDSNTFLPSSHHYEISSLMATERKCFFLPLGLMFHSIAISQVVSF